MIKVTNIETFNFKAAVRGMRNPMNSWAKSDSCTWETESASAFVFGDSDLDLAKRLCKAGAEHRKFVRQIFVSMSILAPLYWFKEFDTYKVGTVANSCSTMHKIHAKEFVLEDFSCERLTKKAKHQLELILTELNDNRNCYLKTQNKEYWENLIQLLPSSYNQLRTVTFSYENALNMIKQRRGHKLQEWREFVDILLQLPYMQELWEAASDKEIKADALLEKALALHPYRQEGNYKTYDDYNKGWQEGIRCFYRLLLEDMGR